MKNPFVRENNNGLIVAVLLGSIAAGALTYLFLTDGGADAREKLKKKAKRKAKELVVKAVRKKTGISKKAVKAVANHVVKKGDDN